MNENVNVDANEVIKNLINKLTSESVNNFVYF